MRYLSSAKQAALDKAQNYWQRANLHPSILQWRPEAIDAFGFYDGSGQWLDSDIKTVEARGQKPLTVNIIQGRIDSLSGVEIQSRFRVACQNDSGNIASDKLAKALTHYLYFIQQNQQIPHKGSLKFRDMLICGLGWSNLYKENDIFYYDYVHPFNVIPDPDDLSPQYNNMKFVCRKRWMEPDQVRKIWPKASSMIDFSNPDLCQTVYSPELMDRNSTYTNITNYSGYEQSRVLVCEVQYKEPKKAYTGIDYQGYYFETFDEEKAEALALSPKDITEIDSYRILRTLFLDNVLLEHSPLNPDIPNLQDFTYIPCVWKRRFRTGVPYGLLDSMKDIQRDANVRITKALYLANSSRLVIKGALPPETANQLSEKLKMPDSVIVLPSQTEYDLKENAPLSEVHLKILQEYEMMMQRVTGIYDDLMGRETNASSGVAQKQRQLNSVRNNVFAFDNFADMKQREAKFLLSLIQGGGEQNILTQVLTEEEREIIILNLTRVIHGKEVIFNDVRTLPISLYVEEVPDFNSSLDENKAALENLLSNPNAMFIMQSPEVMKRLGIRDYEKLAAEIKQAFMGQQQPEVAQSNSAPQMLEQQQNMVYANM